VKKQQEKQDVLNKAKEELQKDLDDNEAYLKSEEYTKADAIYNQVEALITQSLEGLKQVRGVSFDEVTERKKLEDIFYQDPSTPETSAETYEQKIEKAMQSLYGNPPVTTVSDALRKKYGKGKGLWTGEVNGIISDYIHSNKVWREIVGKNEGQAIANFQNLLEPLFAKQGKKFNVIEGTDVAALQENMRNNMNSIKGFYNYHEDGGAFYRECLMIF
jgi:hypothetical protein